MTFELIQSYCLSKLGAYQDCPFGPFPICYKVGNRIFLEWYPDDDKITVRCEPMLADFYRQTYPGIVTVGYHCPEVQKKFKNTIYLNKGLDERLVLDMMDISYEEAVLRLKKTDREKL